MTPQIHNRVPRISIKIQYGTTTTPYRIFGAVLLGFIVFAIVYLNLYLQRLLGESQESIIHSRGLNMTYSSAVFYCDLPYDDCLCPALLNISNISEKCITNVQLVGNRILSLISFLLQIFLARELFSLSGDHRRVIIYFLWITAMIIFISTTVTIYLSSCSHVYITVTLSFTGTLLTFLTWHNMMNGIDHLNASSPANKSVAIHISKRNHNATRAWEEIP